MKKTDAVRRIIGTVLFAALLARGETTSGQAPQSAVQAGAKPMDHVTLTVDHKIIQLVRKENSTGKLTLTGFYTDGSQRILRPEEAVITACTRKASGNVDVVAIEGDKVVPKEGGIASIDAVVTQAGKRFTANTEVIVAPYYRDYHQTLVLKLFLGMEGDPVERLAKEPMFQKPHDVLCTFEEALEVIRKTDNLTRGIPKIVYLVGWQKGGHDHGYPAWEEVNPKMKRKQDATALESLRWLIREGRKFNTAVSLHINMVDAYKQSPLWDEYVAKDCLAKDESGQVFSPGIQMKGEDMYNVVYPKEWEAGLAQRRIDGLIKMIPELKEGHTIHIDVFIANREGGRPVSPWHAKPENGGLTPEKYVETQRKIFHYWRDRGFDVTGEGTGWAHPPGEHFIGLQAMSWWYSWDQMKIPEWLGARGRTDRGGDGDFRFGSSMHGEEIWQKDSMNMPGFLGMFCRTTLPWYYLSRLERRKFENNVLYYSDGVVARDEGGKRVIRKGDFVLREDDHLFVPALWNKKEIIAYSLQGYENRSWQLPDDWRDVKSVDLFKITLEGCMPLKKGVPATEGKLVLSLGKDEAVSVVPTGEELAGRILSATAAAGTGPSRYAGRFCAGEGDVEFLRLIDESFAFFHPNPVVPNLTMIYQPEWDTLVEAGGWNAWWIQNSYGFSYAATPFLQEPWFSLLQRSLDLFWNLQGDGERVGRPDFPLVAPDGCLGDCASPEGIVYKQGDGDWKNVHDWFHEATAAGVVMQAEILLANRDSKVLAYYLPKMERACDSIERTRDPKNNLFLVGPACNLLAPSYGGVKQPDGSFGKGYLAGVSITYLAALDRMVELYKLAGDKAKLAEYERRQKITRASLPLLLAPDGYFVKSVEPGGIKHGALGQKQFGYLEGVANADAVALRVADDRTSEAIYRQIAAFPAIRPFDFLLANAPGLDDTYWNWGNTTGPGMGDIHQFGDWVNGGAWSTVEGRAILMYYRLGKFEDIRRSGCRAMKWAKDFRLDSPWSQRGENSNNSWYDEGKWLYGSGVKVTADNFAIPAATIRGLFDYDYRFDRLILRPRVPGSITQYTQKEPIRFGKKTLFLSCRNGGPKVKSVTVNGKAVKAGSPEAAVLVYDDLPSEARVDIITEGGWPKEESTASYPAIPALIPVGGKESPSSADLPESLKKPFAVLGAMDKLLAGEPDAVGERKFVAAAMQACEDYRVRATLDAGQGYYRAITPTRRAAIVTFYEQTALDMYKGFAGRMAAYAGKDDPQKKRLAAMFENARRSAGESIRKPGGLDRFSDRL